MTRPWGYKVTVHIYVEGDINDAERIASAFIKPADLLTDDHLDFMGIDIKQVTDRPLSQEGS